MAYLKLILVRAAIVISALLGCLVLFLFGWELYLRTFSIVDVVDRPMIREDPVVGFTYLPGAYHHQSPEFDVIYQINSRGDHDDEPETFAGLRPILVLGDSHTMATGVNFQQAWPGVLESLLKARTQAPVQVYNMAVGSYNLSQEYFRLLRDGLQYNPSLVILGFSMSTDVHELLPPNRAVIPYPLLPMQYLDLEGDGLTICRWPGGGSVRWVHIKRNWRVYREIRNSGLGLFGVSVLRRMGFKIWPAIDFVFSTEQNEPQKYAWTVLERILVEFKRTLEPRGIKFLVVIIPSYAQIYDDAWHWVYSFDPKHFDRYAANRRIEAICRRRNIDYLDLTGAFVKFANDGRKLHYSKDGHPNRAGHDLIAQQAFKYFIGDKR